MLFHLLATPSPTIHKKKRSPGVKKKYFKKTKMLLFHSSKN